MRTSLDDVLREWLAVQVRTGREHFCAQHLRTRGYTVFLPSYYEYRHWSDRLKKVERALFAGYVFCLIAGDVSAKLVTTPGVIRVVGDGQRPLAVARDEIDAIQRIVTVGMRAEPWQFWKPGQRVRVAKGPLSGIEGTVVRTHNGHHLIVSVSMLQRSIAVEIEPTWVLPMDPVVHLVSSLAADVSA